MKKYDNMTRLSIPDGTHNTDVLYTDGKNVYKIFNDNGYINEKERNVTFLINNKIPNSTHISKKIHDKKRGFIGYIMEYIPNTMTFRQAIGKSIPLENKEQAIRDVYEALKHLHSLNIYLGDIHSDNVLIADNGNGFLIDLEEIRFPGDEFKFKQCYLVKPNDESYRLNIPTVYTDNVKLMICSLSLLLDVDLETYISKRSHDINMQQLFNTVIKPLNNQKLNDYFLKIINGEETTYFSDACLSKKTNRK